MDTEQLYAVFDCKGAGTGFIGITDKRLIFYDKAAMRVKKSLTSVPFSRITSVSEFWGGDKAQKAYMLIMRELLQNET